MSEMCGLVGVAGNITQKQEKVFRELLQIDTIRGPHSTGVAAIDFKGVPSVVKEAVLPPSLFKRQGFKTIMNKLSRVLIGHNRWATQGAINSKNAHPFQKDHITMVHNGTLANQSLLPDHKLFEVDSENIAHALKLEDPKEVWGKIHGAAALVWYNEKENTLHFLRNKERPFHYTYCDNGCLYWASEDWMLEGILGRNRINYSDIVETLINHEYVFKVNLDATLKEERVSLETITEHKPYVPPAPVVYNKGGWGQKYLPKKYSKEPLVGSRVKFFITQVGEEVRGRLSDHPLIDVQVFGGKGNKTISSSLRKTVEGTINNLYRMNGEIYQVGIQANSVEKIGDTKSFNTTKGKQRISEGVFNMYTKDGCSVCTTPVDFSEDVFFDEHNDPICPSCQEVPWVDEYFNFNFM